ncbi:MAG: aromatic-ring-hydroxylating dioxygenase subunit beta [Hydrogenophaga sp.]|jgi:3-phenylpropionate/cinnamic acid dioxygenase small subunit|uniref:aromatic-ring-hydroxylating dioxygenase subunit beta n=1 Tax=Hydrogenophaga sp. TaxID=1904254 RepID=UPI002629747D|nr:aromatic-ring-hydroxylating dioxygenase subunit beta [Hydrogenophaga sp.]MCW5669381.1 aromatic-ring-hydroxylating dioxygenase subunit beta [Hydrogenophaga sp.]
MTLLTDLISLNADYASAIDDDRLEDWPAFFTDACLYRITTAQNHARGMQAGLVYADSRQMLADRVLSLRKANIYERQAYRHIVGLPRIDSEDIQGVTRVRTSFVVLRIMRTGETEIFASGNFLDEVVRVDGKLLLQRRDVICDSQRIDTLLALPL